MTYWHEVYGMQQSRHSTNRTLAPVKWEKPSLGWFKCNVIREHGFVCCESQNIKWWVYNVSNKLEIREDEYYWRWNICITWSYSYCCKVPKNVKMRKFQNVTRFGWRVTILECREHVLKGVQSWHDFGKTWHVFRLAGHVLRIRLVVPWVVRINRVTFWQNVTRFCPNLNTLKAFFDPFVG